MTKSFKYLDDLIHSGVKEIVLDTDIVLDAEEENEYLEGIVLDRDVVIEGKEHTIDARGKSRIFKCTGKVRIWEVIFKNGFSKDCGGAIDNSGDLTISNSEFRNNTADGDGGAVKSIGRLRIRKSVMCENVSRGEDNFGGAVFACGDSSIKKNSFH